MAKIIPRKDNEFNEEQEIITTTTEKNISQWGIDQTWFNGQVLPAKNAWVLAWAAYLDPAIRTALITFTKNKARKTYETVLRILVKANAARQFISACVGKAPVAKKARGARSLWQLFHNLYCHKVSDINLIRSQSGKPSKRD
jgi:hypothetical protein